MYSSFCLHFSCIRLQTGASDLQTSLAQSTPYKTLTPLGTYKKNIQLKYLSCLTMFKVLLLLGLQYSVFHGSNSLYHHSSLQRQKGNCSRGVHGHKQILQDEEADVDSSAHTWALNNEDAKKPRFLQIIKK